MLYIYKLEYKIFLERFIKNILYSYYHLWYIQGYFSYIFVAYFFIRKKYTDLVIIVVTSMMSLIVYLLYYEINIQNHILKIFLNNFRMYNFIFFISGYLIRKNKIILKNNLRNFIIFICLFILNSICIYFLKTYRIFSIIVFYLGNTYTIFYVLSLIDKFKNIKINLINNLGKNSLYIYLYHMLPIIVLKKYVNYTNYFIYKVFFILSLIILLYYMTYGKKILAQSIHNPSRREEDLLKF